MAERSIRTALAGLGPDQRAAMQELRKIVHAAVPQLTEAIKWGQLCLVDADGKAVLALIAHARHANVQLFDAVGLVNAYPQLEGTGKGARHLKCPYAQPIDVKLVSKLVKAAVRNWKKATA